MNHEQIVQMVEGLVAVDLTSTPTMTFTVKLRDNLVKLGYLDQPAANRLVTTMEIELGQYEISDEHMDRLVAAFTELLHKTYVALRERGFDDEDFVRLASRFNMKLG
jgi:hypothetical protein